MKIGELIEHIDARHKELWSEYHSQGLAMGFARFLVTGLVMADNRKAETDTEIATLQVALVESQRALLEAKQVIAHRDELLRIQGDTCERYKAALERIESNCLKGEMPAMGTNEWLLWRAGNIVRMALSEAAQEKGEEKQSAFEVNEVVDVAFYGIDATFYHRARVQQVVLTEQYSKPVHKYLVWFDNQPSPAIELFSESRLKKASSDE